MSVFPANAVRLTQVTLSTTVKHVVGGDASRVALILSNTGSGSINVYFSSVNPSVPFIKLVADSSPVFIDLDHYGDVVIQSLSANASAAGATLSVTEVVVA